MDLFNQELAEMYDAERQLLRALPKMAKAANYSGLREAFEQHLEETHLQVERLEEVFSFLELRPKAHPSKVMHAILQEAETHRKMGDAALIAAAQKVEHFEIASYTALYTWARVIEAALPAMLLHDTLMEEKITADKLNAIAEAILQARAVRSEAVAAAA